MRVFRLASEDKGIVRCYPALQLRDVYAVVSRYMADPTPFDDYLRLCDEQAEAVGREIRATQRPSIGKEELLARARAKGLVR